MARLCSWSAPASYHTIGNSVGGPPYNEPEFGARKWERFNGRVDGRDFNLRLLGDVKRYIIYDRFAEGHSTVGRDKIDWYSTHGVVNLVIEARKCYIWLVGVGIILLPRDYLPFRGKYNRLPRYAEKPIFLGLFSMFAVGGFRVIKAFDITAPVLCSPGISGKQGLFTRRARFPLHWGCTQNIVQWMILIFLIPLLELKCG